MDELSPGSDRARQRNSAACDACRARKVKCTGSGDASRCLFCIELHIECTRIRPRKKRGPKNRYVQALRAQLDGGQTEQGDAERFNLGLIAPYDIIQQVMTDWFDWIHPVAPIMHRSLFLQRVAQCQGSDIHSSASFFLLVTSVCAATVASLRRRRSFYGELTVEHCIALAERFRLWSPNSIITLERTLTLYNLSSAVQHEYGTDSALPHRIMAETAISLKYLIYHELDQMSFMDQQILKRVYWLVFAGQCTCDMHGRRLLVLHHAHEAVSALTPMAISDGQLLYETESDAALSPAQNLSPEASYVAGLNALSSLFLIWQSSQATATQTMENLQGHISRAHQALHSLPAELSWQEEATNDETSHFGFNVEKVNLKITQLHVRSNLLEQMNTIARAQHLRVTPDVIIDERHRVVDELLEILYRMPNEVFDANGYSIVPKIRDIGSALLDELRTGSHGRTLQASINLDKLLARMEDLDLRPMAQTPYL